MTSAMSVNSDMELGGLGGYPPALGCFPLPTFYL